MSLALRLPVNSREQIVNVKDKAQTGTAPAHLTGAHPNYLQVAGTNIEDFERAMRSVRADTRVSLTREQTEPEVTA
jgi:hypothetical protein